MSKNSADFCLFQYRLISLFRCLARRVSTTKHLSLTDSLLYVLSLFKANGIDAFLINYGRPLNLIQKDLTRYTHSNITEHRTRKLCKLLNKSIRQTQEKYTKHSIEFFLKKVQKRIKAVRGIVEKRALFIDKRSYKQPINLS